MTKPPRFFKFLFLILISVLSLNVSAVAVCAEHIIASGCSVSNVGYLSELAREYEKHTGTKVFVRGGGSVVGIEDLRQNRVDIAASCRKRDSGDPDDIEHIQVAWDALVFVVHKLNPVENISLDSVKAIYAGKINDWKQLGGIHAPVKVFISRPRKGLSGVESSTNEMVLKGRSPVRTPHTLFLASTGIVEEMVIKTPEGFGTTGYSSARKRDLKMLKVNGVYPSRKSIINNTYPFKRPLYLLISKNAKPAAKKFIVFALSKEGQQFISSSGAVSLSDIK